MGRGSWEELGETMDNSSKQKLLSSVHKAYLKSVHSGTLGDKPGHVLSQDILAAFDAVYGFYNDPQEREVSILLSDLRGFTAMSENYRPIEIIDLLNRYFTAMAEVINDHGGTIDKFMGDAIMVVFGSPESKPDDLERALSCAVSMQLRLSEFNQDNQQLGYPALYMGIGINTGSVVAGKLGSDLYSEFTVIGDHVNLASRVESYSLRGQILISENTFNLTKDYIDVGQINTLSVKGKQKPVQMYELLAINKPKHLKVPDREDRKSPRIELYMPLSFQLVEGKSISEVSYDGEIIDLSYGGMYVESHKKLAALSEIKFPLSLSLSANKQSDVYAKVIRINPMIDSYRYNLEFSSISEDAEKSLRNYINRIIEGL